MKDVIIVSGGNIQRDFALDFLQKNKKENKVQCLPGILSDDPALYYYEYVDTSKLNSDRGNTTQKGKNRR